MLQNGKKRKTLMRLPPDADSLRQHNPSNYLAYLVRHPSLKNHQSPLANGWELVGGHCHPVRHMRPALPLHLPAPGPAEERDGDERENDVEGICTRGEKLNLMNQETESDESENNDAGFLE